MFNNKKCYKFIEAPFTWNYANEFCQKLKKDANLAIITSPEENTFVKNMSNNKKWIGCFKNKDEWQWLDGSNLKAYNHWGSNKANNKSYCLQHRDGFWGSGEKEKKLSFVCSYSPVNN
tara:strand:- start:672 stop:1025 length:354 start_codon:yes stop_codon:yes gene_type:complete